MTPPWEFLVNLDPSDDCIPWPYSKNHRGYGRVYQPGSGRGAGVSFAHRKAY